MKSITGARYSNAILQNVVKTNRLAASLIQIDNTEDHLRHIADFIVAIALHALMSRHINIFISLAAGKYPSSPFV